ncbi:multidrug resistance-associated protein 1-like [Babylonia areolata]|uniref:multidrug resistance-associated protein 1-like n=1 Tax=Babylonia areolata TaxID=304850 RepID=UPI003FCFCA43
MYLCVMYLSVMNLCVMYLPRNREQLVYPSLHGDLAMDQFCGETFWNATLIWNNSWPQLSSCFLDLVVKCAPCVVFWLAVPGHVLMTETSHTPHRCWLPASRLSTAKLACGAVMCVLSLLEFLWRLTDHSWASVLGNVVLIITLMAGTLMTRYEKRRCLITSPPLFIFWTLKTCCDVIPFYTHVMQKDYHDDSEQFAVFLLGFGLTLAMTVLYAFADPSAVVCLTRRCPSGGQKICPETTASFLNALTFTWMFRLMVQGYRRSVEMSELWDLPHQHQSDTLMRGFERLWAQEVQRCHKLNKRQSSVAFAANGQARSRRERFCDLSGEAKPLLEKPRDGGHHHGCSPKEPDGPEVKRTLTARYGATRERQPAVTWHGGHHQSVHALHESCCATEEGEEEEEGAHVHVRPDRTTAGAGDCRQGAARPSLGRVLLRQFGASIAVFLVQRLVSNSLFISIPLILGKLVHHLNHRSEAAEWQGYMWALALFLTGTVRMLFHTSGSSRAFNLGLQFKSVVISAVYNKALRISHAAKRRVTTGEVTSLMSVDARRLQESIVRLYFGVTVPVVFLAVVGIISCYVGSAASAAAMVLVVLVPGTGFAAACQKKIEEKFVKHKDLRVRLWNEIVNGIKVIKLNSWELSFKRRISEARKLEIQCLWRVALLHILVGFCRLLMAYMVTLATFAWYVLTERDHVLDASTAFVVMTLLFSMTQLMESLGLTFSFLAQAKVSLRRVNDFLCSEELDFDSVVRNSPYHDEDIFVKRATFTWSDPSVIHLKNIDLRVGPSQLVAVVGQVGAGKSSLLCCLLGEMLKLKGQVFVKGSVAYVAQEALIQNGTVRDNILFGLPYLPHRFSAVLRACQLEQDLSTLPAGDMTEIGEKGINLSGGQKQRVNLARAVYSDSDIYLLDDPLSAVDSHVGKAIFTDVIGPKGMLKGKTRVLVTHGIHWLPLVDEIVVLKEGQISEVGSYSQLLQHNGDLAQLLRSFFIQEDREVDSDVSEEELTDPEGREKVWADVESATTDVTDAGTSGDELSRPLIGLISRRHRRRRRKGDSARCSPRQTETDEKLGEQGRLTQSETVKKGKFPMSSFLYYPQTGGWVCMLTAVFFFSAFRAVSVMTNFWLRHWTEDPILSNQSLAGSEVFVNTNNFYLTRYGLLGVLQVLFLLAFNGLYWMTTIRASRRLHDGLITSILRAPMTFFDTTPTGRIMNRISADMENVDSMMPRSMNNAITGFTDLVAAAVVQLAVYPPIIVVLVPVFVLFYFTMAAHMAVSRQCLRMEAVTRSPIFSHFCETVSGAATIRAYRATDRFMAQSRARVDSSHVFYYVWASGFFRWIDIILPSMVNLLTLIVTILVITSPNATGGAAGLAVSYVVQMQGISYILKRIAEFETNVVSVERIKEYSELEPEAPWVKSERRPTPTWPPRGKVEFRDFHTRYRPGLELVLKGVTCHIQGGEKIGIVGRTGAGKSSLSLALFRLIEAAGGAILIDGVDIADLGLHDLRSRLTILPQDPVLFLGSLRFNLDPFEEHSDCELWRALDQAHLRHFVSGLPGTLDFVCDQGGHNLSVGQRQLLCLARTLLRRTRVLVLDEATAAVDVETDALIQVTVRQAFTHCTVLTIAHRLHTVLHCDRILVLDAGEVQEFDTPQNLLAKPDSIFAAMVKDAGLA